MARYEYDDWGTVTRMYNRYGERVREGIGWIGDLGTGDGSPGSLQGPEDISGNTTPDYHPGIGNDQARNAQKVMDKYNAQQAMKKMLVASITSTPETDALVDKLDLYDGTETPTEDISTELVKENPFRYAGYYFDRKTLYYYLQARYYDPRLSRFISEDTYEGEIDQPITLNQYTYANNNPIANVDPTGHAPTTLEAAYMAQHIYEATKPKKIIQYQ